MHEKFNEPYDPSTVEDAIYTQWEQSDLFHPETAIEKGYTKPDAEPYTIVLPPPNVTGVLHMGHATMLAIEDILIRFERMRGKRALWIPGTDSAAIATQSVVEKQIYKEEKKSRHDLGREELLKRIDAFTQESHKKITAQVKKMGASLDWNREAFTLDDTRYNAVMEAFIRMHDAGLIYQGYRVVNWDVKGQTTVSDDEVEHEETKGMLYTFRYSKDFPIPIATTRPETKVGDVAVAVHPEDTRYTKYIGQTFDLTFAGVPLSIHIVGDEAVNPEYGTGAVGITPAHSHTDSDIAKRHNLEMKKIINEYGKMENVSPELDGLKTKDAREKIVAWIRENGLMEKEEEITINLSRGDRTKGVIEPLPKKQWFMDVTKKFTLTHSNITGIASGEEVTLKEVMLAAVQNGDITFLPERFEKVYYRWVENLRPWCLSRQIWYGHRIPAWYKGGEIKVQKKSPGDGWEQDPDTLDTWFSSGLWSFSTLGWPDSTPDLELYHPTSVLETGYDIVFFWVARMILMSGFHLGEVPFKKVYLHGLVRDAKGQKMSKSKGNGIDPLDMIEKYGADAVRMALVLGAAPGNDVPFDENKVRGYKHFANKIWNATRFVLQYAEAIPKEKPTLSPSDEKEIEDFTAILAESTKHIENFRLDLAGDMLYHYFWHTYADVIIEESKTVLSGEDATAKKSTLWKLYYILTNILKALHPFMPFITEEIWKDLPHTGTDMLMVAPWPHS